MICRLGGGAYQNEQKGFTLPFRHAVDLLLDVRFHHLRDIMRWVV